MTLESRAAIITGASQGLGREIARQFVSEGANVAICARDGAMLEETASDLRSLAGEGQKIWARVCDVSVEAQMTDFTVGAIAELGSVQILVANAGVLGPKGPAESVDIYAWTKTVEINLFGAMYACRALIPHLKQGGYGKIVAISGGGATSPFPNMSAYAASKAALVRVMETLAEELKGTGIDVNSVAPGVMNTRMMQETLAAGPEAVGVAHHAKMLAQVESGRATPDKAALLCVFLASAASDGITGKLISAQWDPWKTMAARRGELASSDIYTLRRITPEDRGKNWG